MIHKTKFVCITGSASNEYTQMDLWIVSVEEGRKPIRVNGLNSCLSFRYR